MDELDRLDELDGLEVIAFTDGGAFEDWLAGHLEQAVRLLARGAAG